MMMKTFTLGSSEREQLVVFVHGYERAQTGEYYDDNWLTVDVSVHAGAFEGRYSAAFLTEEFVRFNDALKKLYESLRGEAVFRTLEEQLSVQVVGNGRGEIQVLGTALDRAGTGNKLVFHLEIDQTHLAPAIRDLNEIISAFPVRRA